MAVTSDPEIRKAVAAVQARSERAEDPGRLVATFVDGGLLELVGTSNNQVLYGRRGTGKTHVLRVFQSKLTEQADTLAVYIDARTLGSTELFTDKERPLGARLLGLFRDLILELHSAAFEYLVERAPSRSDAALETLGSIELSLNRKEATNEVSKTTTVQEFQSKTAAGLKGSVGMASLGVSAELGGEAAAVGSTSIESTSTDVPKIVIPDLHHDFKRLIDELGLARLALLVDEWSSVPIDLQPYLAEFISRLFFANPKVTVKLASLEFRSSFSLTDSKGRKTVGVELSSDIETVDLDESYVYDRDPGGTEALFADVLYRHLNSGAGEEDYLDRAYGVHDGQGLIKLLFTEQAFKELVRAAEGVARDLLQIFVRAFQRAWKDGAEHLTVPIVAAAAQAWFENDKQQNLNDEQLDFLESLVSEVIGARRARSFMVAREDSSADLLQSLIDQRVVHIIRKGYADKDNPGKRYNIYTLDYGCYVDLKGTAKQPQGDFTESAEGEDAIVPFDDKRSIRRIIVNRDLLDPTSTKQAKFRLASGAGIEPS